MLRWTGICRTALVVLALATVGLSIPAHAGPRASQLSFSATARLDRYGGTFHYLYALSGDLSKDGVIVRIGAGGGATDEAEETYSLDALAGYQFLLGGWKVRTLVGVTYVERDDGGEAGFKVMGQVQNKKSDDIYANATASYSSAKGQISAGLQVGMNVGGLVLGPDVGVIVGDDWLRTRLGVFVTGLRLGDVGVTVRGGYSMSDSEDESKDSPYVGVTSTLQF